MAVERRFLLASSLARLIQRESAAPTRIVEGHFAPHPNRRQLVRVERDRALLVLLSRTGEGPVDEEEVEVPRAHAEALIDVAAGTVAFDRIPVRIARRGIESSARLGRHRWVVERSLARFSQFRRLAIRYAHRADIHLAFTTLASAIITWRFVQRWFCEALLAATDVGHNPTKRLTWENFSHKGSSSEAARPDLKR